MPPGIFISAVSVNNALSAKSMDRGSLVPYDALQFVQSIVKENNIEDLLSEQRKVLGAKYGTIPSIEGSHHKLDRNRYKDAAMMQGVLQEAINASDDIYFYPSRGSHEADLAAALDLIENIDDPGHCSQGALFDVQFSPDTLSDVMAPADITMLPNASEAAVHVSPCGFIDDVSGTSITRWIQTHLITGTKFWLVYPPTPQNLDQHQTYCYSPSDYKKVCSPRAELDNVCLILRNDHSNLDVDTTAQAAGIAKQWHEISYELCWWFEEVGDEAWRTRTIRDLVYAWLTFSWDEDNYVCAICGQEFDGRDRREGRSMMAWLPLFERHWKAEHWEDLSASGTGNELIAEATGAAGSSAAGTRPNANGHGILRHPVGLTLASLLPSPSATPITPTTAMLPTESASTVSTTTTTRPTEQNIFSHSALASVAITPVLPQRPRRVQGKTMRLPVTAVTPERHPDASLVEEASQVTNAAGDMTLEQNDDDGDTKGYGNEEMNRSGVSGNKDPFANSYQRPSKRPRPQHHIRSDHPPNEDESDIDTQMERRKRRKRISMPEWWSSSSTLSDPPSHLEPPSANFVRRKRQVLGKAGEESDSSTSEVSDPPKHLESPGASDEDESGVAKTRRYGVQRGAKARTRAEAEWEASTKARRRRSGIYW
ncbi:hypothetical protein K491DRAFT_757907 [Lophiostoma macrostomum CBS 122681]|uniref:Uncharacterized protein n=1 Tax=Lophiostoma macrostomum CBS 122681 TaxID=1314788 RepID=A0A6A6TBI8_9PLEO|nr:hypothetical protein K491DRAFT_757907 [Lophiostoma macrostomum CBS 122681]